MGCGFLVLLFRTAPGVTGRHHDAAIGEGHLLVDAMGIIVSARRLELGRNALHLHPNPTLSRGQALPPSRGKELSEASVGFVHGR